MHSYPILYNFSVSGPARTAMTPCTPYCPGVTGFPELECNGCQSLFHSKCVGIAPNLVGKLKRSFKCKVKLTKFIHIPTRGNLFLPVRLLVWADGRGTVEPADSAASAEHFMGLPNQSYCS
jgi:hypothetical protein